MNEEMSSSTQPQESKKKSKGIWSAILIPALIFGISSAIGESIGEAAGDMISESNEISKIEQFTEQAKEYVPGTITEDSYRSEFWDLEFQTGDSWFMADEADREALSQEILASEKSSAASAIEDKDISQELKDAYLNSIYGAVEMYALYADEEGYCAGEANIIVTQIYGLDELSEEEYLQNLTDGLSNQYKNVTTSQVTVAGKTHSCIEFDTEQNGITLRIKCIYMIKGISHCLIRITYLDGYEEVCDSFLAQLSACS